ncbi:IS4 family transposase [Spirosoma gilvum]
MGPSFRQTVAALFAHQRMSESVMLEGHLLATLQRAKDCQGDYLIAAQDTTYYNYTTHQAMTGLGTIQGDTKGIIQHNVLLMNQTGVPLGLLDQQYWSRQGDKPFEGKESLKWIKGLAAVNRHLGQSAKPVVLVQDREADIFAFFKAQRAPSVDLLVRVHQPRKLEVVSSGQVYQLPELAAHLPVLGEHEVEVLRAHQLVRLRLRLQACKIHVWPDKDHSVAKHKTAPLWVVIAREVGALSEQGIDVFDANQVAEWYLLSSLAVDQESDAQRIVGFYSLRWRIERFHYVLKSGGLHVEKLQFDDLQTMVNALAFYSVVGWQLVRVTYLVRTQADLPAGSCFEESEINLLERLSQGPIMTVGQATLAIGKLVGFAGCPKQPMPGVKVLCQALERFYYIKIGYGLNPN